MGPKPLLAWRPRGDDSRRLARIGELVELYEDLEHALGRMDERDLARLAARTRGDERPLAFWARRVARVRGVEVRPKFSLCHAPPNTSGTSSFVWEAVAFVLGFGVSLLFSFVGGA
jgi:hypothetical protein